MALLYADTSFLFALYTPDAHTQKAWSFLRRNSRRVALSPFNRFELANALRLAEFRKLLPPGGASIRLADFEKDVDSGQLTATTCNLSLILSEATRLSAQFTIKTGNRSMDILHVATALHMGADTFLTFDSNQKKLAVAENLTVPL